MNKEEKQNVLSNILSIPSKALAEYILKGEIPIEEMMATGELEASKRIEILNIIEIEKENLRKLKEEELEKQRQNEKIEWNAVSSSQNVDAIESFIQKYPNGIYFREACDLLVYSRDLQLEKIKILEDIKINSNKYTPDVILEFIENKILSEDDLLSIGIPKIILDNLDQKKENLTLGQIPDSLAEGYTEVYFWGLPGSGKTCALSAILSEGVSSGAIQTNNGPGLHYMNQLSNVFLNEIGVLPERTPQEDTQYLPFEIKDNLGKYHPISLVELSGEIFRTFYLKSADQPVPARLQNVYDRVISYLSSNNKKIHFFIIDVTRDPKKPDKDGITQQQYLRAMESFLNTSKIFKNTTDGVYIITTKSDKLSDNPEDRKAIAIQHLKSEYNAFVEALKRSLKSNKLSNRLDLIPFSLGKVYFNDLCYFDNTNSVEIINILKEKTGKKRTITILNKIIDFLNK
jgi:hypothetical protein